MKYLFLTIITAMTPIYPLHAESNEVYQDPLVHKLDDLNRLSNLDEIEENNGLLEEGEVSHIISNPTPNKSAIHAPEGMIKIVTSDGTFIGQSNSQLFVTLEDPVELTKPEAEGRKPNERKMVLGSGDVYSLAIRNSNTLEQEDKAEPEEIESKGNRNEAVKTTESSLPLDD